MLCMGRLTKSLFLSGHYHDSCICYGLLVSIHWKHYTTLSLALYWAFVIMIKSNPEVLLRLRSTVDNCKRKKPKELKLK